ncbi:hydroxyphenylacetyl-CoA thioesterase PaaI [Wandonia haliotis]|uniref:Hydroxyphenylacetyl-CoA thioesterase PaaI n=1 Tax=Wandonia haliotis TaxID=574963 RepID=A0ABP3Y5V6_9FLAO
MSPEEITNTMMRNDAFSQWLGIQVTSTQSGYCKLSMKTRDEMLNGFGILHGGISYSLADSALAFASNSHGQHAVSIETSISHLKPVRTGETLTAIATERSISHKIAIYDIEVFNENSVKIALFKGTVYRKSTEWKNDSKSS